MKAQTVNEITNLEEMKGEGKKWHIFSPMDRRDVLIMINHDYNYC